mmetsp:Transcript_35042/g.49762  ORF Transcript_35042/g.49762 Transcript_35042/m.49762 type:complete len:223 (+) Transcript_35042:15-683(+)
MDNDNTSECGAPSALIIAVGSSNPAKIRSVEQAFQQIVDGRVQLHLEGFSVSSGVPDQPMGDEETKLGAKNRAMASFEAFKEKHSGQEPHLSVGLEGGLEEEGEDLVCMAWMAMYGARTDRVLNWTKGPDCEKYEVEESYTWGLSKTASFLLPPAITKLVKGGLELGDADDKVFSRVKSKHGSGTVGILTDNLIDRSKYYEYALILAITPWIRPDVFPIGNT